MPRPLNEQFKLALEGTMALTYFGLGAMCLFGAYEASTFLGIPELFVYILGSLLALYGAFRGWRFIQELNRD
jgi:hypothetical protein